METKGKNISPHTPQRTCIACRTVRNKRELVRLLRGSDGKVGVDIAGKKPGRGAYLCPKAECWQAGLKKGFIEHALRTTLTESDRQQLREYSESLCEK